MRTRWFVLSVPKSGTHLAYKLMALLGTWAESGGLVDLGRDVERGVPQPDPERVEITYTGRPWYRVDAVGDLLDSISPGCVSGAHAPYSKRFAAMLRDRDIRPVAMLRDPRDVAVSQAHWWLSGGQPEAIRAAAARLSLDERIRLSALGGRLGPTTVLPVAKRFERFVGWMDEPDVPVLRFEELLGAEADAAITSAAAALGLPVTARRVGQIRGMLHGGTATFRRGTSGAWLDETTAATRRQLRDAVGPVAVRLGYAP